MDFGSILIRSRRFWCVRNDVELRQNCDVDIWIRRYLRFFDVSNLNGYLLLLGSVRLF